MSEPTWTGHNFPNLYDGLDFVDVRNLGYVMLDTDPVPVLTMMPAGAEEDLFVSDNPDRWWVKGAVGEQTPHITLSPPLLISAKKYKSKVDQVLEGWEQPTSLEVDHVGAFPTTDPGEEYSAIIAHIKITDELRDGNERLQMLPNIRTYPGYKAHFTLAYVKAAATTEWIEILDTLLAGKALTVHADLNYGK